MKRIAIFCGARMGTQSEHSDLARCYADWMASQQITLVYGGGRTGLMGVVADQVLKQNGQVIGVIPESLAIKEVAHEGLTELHLVKTMHERKQMMSDFADGFIALPGGFGTLDELCEIITWRQLGFHQKPIALANDNGFFDGFIEFLGKTVSYGFISKADIESIQILNSAKDFKWS